METAKIIDIKKEITQKSQKELVEVVLSLAKFKKENKELLTYLLFLSDNEQEYINEVRSRIDDSFYELKGNSMYRYVKGVRKISREAKKYIRYSKQKVTEVELMLHFCKCLKASKLSKRSSVLDNIYDKHVDFVKSKVSGLHDELQLDYGIELREL